MKYMLANLSDNLAALAAQIPFETVKWLIWGSFIAIFVLSLTLTVFLPHVRAASKRPYLCLLYAYTALDFALFLTAYRIEDAAFCACIFWIAGYLGYGVLCALNKRRANSAPAQVAACAAPSIAAPQPTGTSASSGPKNLKTVSPNTVARNNVRLEHAIAVTSRLLDKNLGKSDRQELEKLKNTLEVLKVKGSLTPAEGEILNENFNTLLKLMAKYNV